MVIERSVSALAGRDVQLLMTDGRLLRESGVRCRLVELMHRGSRREIQSRSPCPPEGHYLLTRNAAVTYATRGIRVNTIVPGGIETRAGPSQPREEYFLNPTPMGRYGMPTDIANAAVFLAADESVFVTGSDIVVDGGFTAR